MGVTGGVGQVGRAGLQAVVDGSLMHRATGCSLKVCGALELLRRQLRRGPVGARAQLGALAQPPPQHALAQLGQAPRPRTWLG